MKGAEVVVHAEHPRHDRGARAAPRVRARCRAGRHRPDRRGRGVGRARDHDRGGRGGGPPGARDSSPRPSPSGSREGARGRAATGPARQARPVQARRRRLRRLARRRRAPARAASDGEADAARAGRRRLPGRRRRACGSSARRPGTTLDAAEGAGSRARCGAAARAADGRGHRAHRRFRPPITTKEAKALGIREKISTFTTDMGESSANRIWNVHLLGDYLDGTIVEPGQTFSYNEEVGPRTVGARLPRGPDDLRRRSHPLHRRRRVPDGDDDLQRRVRGRPADPDPRRTTRSTSATTRWGATRRCPGAAPSLVFRNDLKHAILIKVSYTDATFTVTFYGTKQGRRGGGEHECADELHAAEAPVRDRPVRAAQLGDARPRPAGPGSTSPSTARSSSDGKLLRQDDFFTRYSPAEPDRDLRPGEDAARGRTSTCPRAA